MKSLLTLVFLALLIRYASGQEYPRKNIDIQTLTDDLLAQQDLDMNYEELYENLMQLFSNPLSLNTATEEDFRFLNILSEAQLQSLLEYRKSQNGFISLYELQSIEHFDVETIQRFAPFVVLRSNPIKTNLLKHITARQNTYLILRYDFLIQDKKGFANKVDSATQFLGTPGRLYSRFRSSKTGDYSVGITLEKDAGESLQWRPASRYYGFDYTSFHVQFQKKGILKNLILGDFQAQFGQGLLLGGFFGFGKGAETITAIRRSSIGFIPYTSVHETAMLRGAAVTLKVTNHVDLSIFYSHKRKDAVVASFDDASYITSFQTTGLHRNEKELASRNKILESNYGAIASIQHGKLSAGIIMNGTTFQKPVKKVRSVYNQFSFTGIQTLNVGTFASYSFNNFNFFGEYAKSIHGGGGGVIGILGSLTTQMDLALLFRKYAPGFYSFYANAIGESSIPQNESGMYWGWKYTWNKKLSLAGYLDLFSFKWLRYRSYVPAAGHEWMVQLKYAPSKKTVYSIQYKEEVKVRNIPNDGNLYLTAEGRKRNMLMNVNYSLSDDLSMKTRIQGSMYQFNHKSTSGIAILQDINWKIKTLEITGRYALFQTDDYDNRQYTYERDTYLAYSFPSFFGKGVRTYLMVEYHFNQHVSLWLRYGHTRYLDQETIGSGADTIEGNQRNDFRIQLLLRP